MIIIFKSIRFHLLGLSFRSSLLLMFICVVTGEISQERLRFLLATGAFNGAFLLFWLSGVDEAIGLDFTDFLGS